MSDFVGLFLAVFVATVMGKIAGELYDRYIKFRVDSALDKFEEHKKRASEIVKFK